MQTRKVAIIDNDRKVLGEVQEILIKGGYVPVPVIDTMTAVDVVIQNQPDVILVELKMPRKNGFELTDAINQAVQSRRIPVIAMAKSFKVEYRWLLDICGIKRCLKKPFQPLDVIWAIENEIEEGRQLAMVK